MNTLTALQPSDGQDHQFLISLFTDHPIIALAVTIVFLLCAYTMRGDGSATRGDSARISGKWVLAVLAVAGIAWFMVGDFEQSQKATSPQSGKVK